MYKYHNLLTVMRHEFMSIVKQPAFWIAIVAIPAIFAIAIGVSYLSNQASEERVDEFSQQISNTVIVDESDLIRPEIVEQAGMELATDADAAEESVKGNTHDGAIVYPADVAESQEVEIYTNHTEQSAQGAYSNLAQDMLRQSALADISEAEKQIALNDISSNVTVYEDGQETGGIEELIVPGIFLVLFYAILVFSSNYMLTSVLEEKENRAMELILTSVHTRTLIIGKLLGLVLVTLLQLLLLVALAVGVFLVAQNVVDNLDLPIALNELVWEPERIIFGIGFLVLGFLLFAAAQAGVGSMVPSAKEAGNFTVVFIIAAIMPFYIFNTLVEAPEALMTQVFTYFPLTAPVTLLIRNTFGTIETGEAIVALAVLAFFTGVVFWLTAKLFARGALQYTSRVSLKSLFK